MVQDSTILYMYMYMYMYRYGMHDDYICINPELQNPDPMSCIPVACDSLYERIRALYLMYRGVPRRSCVGDPAWEASTRMCHILKICIYSYAKYQIAMILSPSFKRRTPEFLECSHNRGSDAETPLC